MKKLFFILLLILPELSFANIIYQLDLLPSIELEFNQNGKEISDFDDIRAIVQYKRKDKLDTLKTHYDSGIWWSVGAIIKNINTFQLVYRGDIDYFYLEIDLENQVFTSNKIYPIDSWKFLEFNILSNKKLESHHNLFYIKWIRYFYLLFLTTLLQRVYPF